MLFFSMIPFDASNLISKLVKALKNHNIMPCYCFMTIGNCYFTLHNMNVLLKLNI